MTRHKTDGYRLSAVAAGVAGLLAAGLSPALAQQQRQQMPQGWFKACAKQEDVDITLQNGVLTISGEHEVEKEEERGNYHVRERRYGSFRRSMSLPEGTDESKVHARFEDGVLEVTVESAAIEQAPKRIEIEGSSG